MLFSKKIIGIILIIAAVVLYGVSMYIDHEVAEGRQQIASAERKVEQGNRLFSLSPVTEPIGKGITGGIQKKINEGKATAQHYEELSRTLKICAIVLFVVGILCLIFLGRKKK